MKVNRTKSKWWAGLLALGLMVIGTATAADENATAAAPSENPGLESAASQKVYGLPKAEEESSAPESVNMMAVILRIFGALIFVLAILVGGAWWFRKSRMFGLVPVGESHLKIVETKSLGSRHALHVVEYGEQKFLIADSPAGTNFLTNLDGAVAAEEAVENPDAEPEPGSFADKLKTFLKGAQ
tara:strand:- start:47 stop:598 length:552 start_codon:yes stop_codon:yes gene_type:complete